MDNTSKINCINSKLCNQKKAIIAANCIWGLFTAIERSIIIPTLYLYLVSDSHWFSITGDTNEQKNDTTILIAKRYYGATLAAFSVSCMLSMPIFGWVAMKKIISSKMLIIMGNGMEIVGNSLYCAASAPWMLLIGRLIAGIGSGSEVNLMSDLIRVTRTEERTTWVSLCLMARQVGLIAGPCVTLAVSNVKTKLGKFPLDVYNTPLLIMTILWLLQTLQMIVFYPMNVTSEPDESVQLISNDENEKKEDEKKEDEEKPNTVSKDRSCCSSEWSEWMKRNGKPSVFSAIGVTFVGYFCLMGFETVIPPWTVHMLGWNETHISWLYLSAGIAVILTFLAAQPCFKRFSDKKLIIVGLSLLFVSYSIGLTQTSIFATHSDLNNLNNNSITPPPTYTSPLQIKISLVILSILLLFHVIGLVLNNTCADSLFSKLVPPEECELGQAIIRPILSFAFIMGPAISGGVVPFYFVEFLILLISVIISAILTIRYL